MALADFDAFRQAVAAPALIIHAYNAAVFGSISIPPETAWASQYLSTAAPHASGVIPTASVALDYTGALGDASIRHPAAASGQVGLVGGCAPFDDGTEQPMRYLLIDRLVHGGGLSGNTVALQDSTSNPTVFPTAALPRYTDGVGVHAAIQIFTSVGSADTVFNVSYTNSSGTSGRVGRAVENHAYLTGGFLPVSLQSGDVGVRSIESIALSAATGGVGNVGVVLYKPLAMIDFDEVWAEAPQICGWNSPILTEAHLELLRWTAQTGTGSGENQAVVLAFSEL